MLFIIFFNLFYFIFIYFTKFTGVKIWHKCTLIKMQI